MVSTKFVSGGTSISFYILMYFIFEDDFAIPAGKLTSNSFYGKLPFALLLGTLVAGSNTIAINVISGSSGVIFLSPNFVYDSVELF